MQYRPPSPPHRPVGPPCQTPPDFPVQPLPLPVRHAQVPGERVEQLDVLLGRRKPVPSRTAGPARTSNSPLASMSARLVRRAPRPRRDAHPPASPRRSRRRPPGSRRRTDRRRRGTRAPRPERQVPAGPQRLARPAGTGPPGRSSARPSPRTPGLNRARSAAPVLELAPVTTSTSIPGQVLPRRGGQLRAELDAGDPEPAPGQRQRGLPGRAADLQQPVAGRQPGHRDQVIEQRLGIVGPDPVVALGGLVERLPQPLPLSIGPHRGQYRDPWSGVRPRHFAQPPHLGAVP